MKIEIVWGAATMGEQSNQFHIKTAGFRYVNAQTEYSGRRNAYVRTSGKQRSGGRKAPLEQLGCNTYPVSSPVKALPRQWC